MKTVLGLDRPVIAMLHVAPSPGVPGFRGLAAALELLRADLAACLEGGADALLVENMHDFPCVAEREMGPEVAAYMTRLCAEARRLAPPEVPVGVQVLFAAGRTAVAVAQAAELQFVRTEGWLYAHVSDKGPVAAQGGRVKRYQHALGAEDIAIFTDVRKKHASHAWTADLSLHDWTRVLELHRSDGAVVTGALTGAAPAREDLESARAATALPVLLGSGLTPENAATFVPLADAFIVGTALKQDGDWRRPVERPRVAALTERVRALRAAP